MNFSLPQKYFLAVLLLVGILSRQVHAEPVPDLSAHKYKNRFRELTSQKPLGETGFYIVDTISLYAWTWAWSLATQADLRHAMEQASLDRWSNNVGRTPVWDDGNNFVTNNIFHPLAGAFYYQYMRARNHSRWLSMTETFLQSVLFEYTIEGQYTTPSAQDMVKTTGLGVLLGFVMDELSRKGLQSNTKNKKFAGYVLNPMYLLPWARWEPDATSKVAIGMHLIMEF